MYKMNWLSRAMTLGIVAAVVLIPVSSMAQKLGDRKSVLGQEKRTPGTSGGQSGTWVEYTEYVYRYAPPVQKALDAYKDILGVDLTADDLAGIRTKLDNGTLTIDQLRQQLTVAKGLLDSNPEPAKEWHSRDWDMALLRGKFGLTGGWVDGLADTSRAADYPKGYQSIWHGSGDGTSIIGQSTRLVKLAQMMESGVLPAGKFQIKGIFTHYVGTFHPNNSPYYKPFPYTGQYNGGDWAAIYSQGTSDAEVYKWYSQYWGYGLQIDIKNATPKQLMEAAKEIYLSAGSTGSPIALDLSSNNRIGVTGRSTAQTRHRDHTFVADGSVKFDLFGVGKPIRIEWMSSENDALLVDDRKGEVTKAANSDGIISGKQLFGNAGGFDNGYIKLALILTEYNRLASANDKGFKYMSALRGQSLDGLKAWVDGNRDAKVQPHELRTLDSLGITEIEVFPKRVKNAMGETLIQSTYVEQSKRKLAEDVWFAIDPAEKI